MQTTIESVDDERWRAAPGWPGYEVSDHGRIRRLLRRLDVHTDRGIAERELSPRVVRARVVRGRVQAQLRTEAGRWRTIGVAALVLAAFVGPRPRGLVARQDTPGSAALGGVRWAERSRGRMRSRPAPSPSP